MNLTELRKEMERNLVLAKRNITEYKHLAPVAFVYVKDNLNIVSLRFKDAREKDLQMSALASLVQELHADGIITIIESWYVQREAKDFKNGVSIDKIDIIPSQQPDRKEAIMLYGECPTGIIAQSQLFHHEGEDIVFDDIKEMDDSISRFGFGIKHNGDMMYG